MKEIKPLDFILLKDGRKGTVNNILKEEIIVEIGSSITESEIITVKKKDIKRILKDGLKSYNEEVKRTDRFFSLQEKRKRRWSLFKFVGEHPWRFLFYSNAIAFIIILLMFQLNINLIPTKPDTTPKDWLAFAGGYLSFFGTLFLGIVAIHQNNRLFDFEEKRKKFEEIKYCSYIKPDGIDYIDCIEKDADELVISIHFHPDDMNEGKKTILFKFYFRCITEAPIQNIEIGSFKFHFGPHMITEDGSRELTSINVYAKSLFDCGIQKDGRVSLKVYFYDIKVDEIGMPLTKEFDGRLWLTCTSLYGKTSPMYLDFCLEKHPQSRSFSIIQNNMKYPKWDIGEKDR